MKKDILIISYGVDISGVLFDSFEYYYYLKNYFNVDFLKILRKINKDVLIQVLKDKYKLDNNFLNNHVIIVNERFLKKIVNISSYLNNYRSLLFLGLSSLANIISKFNLKKLDNYIFCLHDNLNYNHKKYLKDCQFIKKQPVFLRDKRVSHIYDSFYRFANNMDYTKKINFSIFKDKKYNNPDNVMLMNLNCKHKYHPKQTIKKIIEKYRKDFNIIIYTTNNDYNFNYSNVIVVEPPILDLYDKYSTYLYIPSIEDKVDVSPRLIPESIYYGKIVIYEDEIIKPDLCSYIRYQDSINNFDSIVLKENDDIISILNSL